MSSSYIFEDAANQSELSRLRLLESVFDESSQRLLRAAGVASGARCLEVGAGAGSIAAWMSEVVGPSGQVAAVDMSARFLRDAALSARENLVVHEGDIRAVPLDATFDVAHARFVFIHVPAWRDALGATLRALVPGGRIVLEEPDFSASRALAGSTDLCEAFARVGRAIEALFAARGADFAFGARLPQVATQQGLESLVVENHAPAVQGGSPCAAMMSASAAQLRDKYVATGLVTDADVDAYRAFAADSRCWAIYHGTVRIIATKPAV